MNQKHYPNFYENARKVHISDLAETLHLTLDQKRTAASPCPICSYSQRSFKNKDKRKPLGFRLDGRGWQCHHCHEKGDGLDLVACTLEDKKYHLLTPAQQHSIHQWYEKNGFYSSTSPHSPPLFKNVKRPQRETQDKKELQRPPQNEVLSLWNASIPVTQDHQVKTYLEKRGINPLQIEEFDLARALPPNAPQYSWMSAKYTSWKKGWRLLIPAFGHQGQIESIKARWIHLNQEQKTKSVSPKTFSVTGLLMTESLGSQLLSHAAIPSWWENEELHLIIVEGEPDFLSLVCHGGENPYAPAVFGIWAGSWNEHIIKRIPKDPRLRITIATHQDTAGEQYAFSITTSLLKHGIKPQQLWRWKP